MDCPDEMCNAVSSVKQSATLCGSSLLSDHTLYLQCFGRSAAPSGQRPQSAALSNKKVTRNCTEDWRALSTDNETMNSSLPSEKDPHTPVQPLCLAKSRDKPLELQDEINR